MRIIIGLGNPGKKYERTRHNAGFRAVNELARRLKLEWKNNKKLKAGVAQGNGFVLIKPQTFMNESGATAAAALNRYKLPPEELTVIHDDLDISLGKYKISADSRSAGHKGVESIIGRLKTKNFRRIRIGIAPALKKAPAEEFVLKNFSAAEDKIVK